MDSLSPEHSLSHVMSVSAVLLLSLVSVVLAQMGSERNIITECLLLLYCDGETHVCGTNGSHCWHADSDCERASFNCLQLYKQDFDKVDLSYCSELTVGAITPCCIQKTCPDENKPICGQATTHKTLSKCKSFRNRCDMENFNCESGKNFIEVDRALCNFALDSDERHCIKPSAKTAAAIE